MRGDQADKLSHLETCVGPSTALDQARTAALRYSDLSLDQRRAATEEAYNLAGQFAPQQQHDGNGAARSTAPPWTPHAPPQQRHQPRQTARHPQPMSQAQSAAGPVELASAAPGRPSKQSYMRPHAAAPPVSPAGKRGAEPRVPNQPSAQSADASESVSLRSEPQLTTLTDQLAQTGPPKLFFYDIETSGKLCAPV